jgi:pimeloyl-ACP methyl ester carboxylesterase
MATAVLVHGAWSSPADWRWVAPRLQGQGIQVIMPDLPSHRDLSAGRLADVEEVQAAIGAAAPPVAVVGWSYGGDVISGLTDTSRVDRLVYVGSYPEPAETSGSDEPFDPSGMPGLLFHDDKTVELDTDWFLSTPEVATWPDEVVSYLRENRRRPITSQAWLASPLAEAWRTVPSTILIGRSDQFVPAEMQQQLGTQFDDVRLVDGDHFLLFLRPDVVAEVIAETLAP